MTVHTIHDVKGWVVWQLQKLGGAGLVDRLRRVFAGGLASMSTAFSGIEAPEQACEDLWVGLGLDEDTHVQHLSCTEWNIHSRHE